MPGFHFRLDEGVAALGTEEMVLVVEPVPVFLREVLDAHVLRFHDRRLAVVTPRRKVLSGQEHQHTTSDPILGRTAPPCSRNGKTAGPRG